MEYTKAQLFIIDTLQRIFLNLDIINQTLSDKGSPINQQQKKHITELIQACLKQQRMHEECVANIHIEAQVKRCMEYVQFLQTRTMVTENLDYYEEVLVLLQKLRY